MKKYILLLIALLATISINAQVIRVYKNNELEKTYTNTTTDKYKVEFTKQYYSLFNYRKKAQVYLNDKHVESYENSAEYTYKVVFEEKFEPTYVDLGLTSGTLWATCNVGAKSPEQYGYYFAWGERSPKKTYTEQNYKWRTSGDPDTTSKYTIADNRTTGIWYSGNTFIGDNKTVLEAEDDAATAYWGTDWCIPTKDQVQELIENCDWEYTKNYNGTNVEGFIVSSKKEGNTNSIFLPFAGYYHGYEERYYGNTGYYWSSNLDENTSLAAKHFEISISVEKPRYQVDEVDRVFGLPVRAVRKASK